MDILLKDGDIVIDKNDVVLITGQDEIRQRVIQRLQFFLGEWFLDRSRGIPYFQEIFQKGVDSTSISALFKQEILAVDGVIELVSFDMSYETQTRVLTINTAIRSQEGVVSVQVAI